MVYSSLLFIYGFLPISLLLFYAVPKKYREAVLLLLSIVFCGMISLYFLIFISVFTAVNFAFAHLIAKTGKNRRLALIPLVIGSIIDIAALTAFRTRIFLQLYHPVRAPDGFYAVGISFFALAAVGTLIDIFRGRTDADRNFVRFALYIMFFPKLIMGPLMRYGDFTKAAVNRCESLDGIGKGMALFAKGLAKKVIAADNLYMLYNAVYSVEAEKMSALTAWLGITAYLFCLYFTLSGFADMGVGAARCFGFVLPQSFGYPLMRTRIRYFAARWQIQVKRFITGYVTKPVCGVCMNRRLKNVVFVCGWLLFGYWYTLNANGALWGLLIGSAVMAESALIKNKPMKLTGIIYTFLTVIVCTVFLSGGTPFYSVRFLFAMIGGNGAIADSQAFYLLKSYLPLLLITVFASTNMFRSMMKRPAMKRVRAVVNAMTPLIVIAVIAVCTAFISYGGSSEMMLVKL